MIGFKLFVYVLIAVLFLWAVGALIGPVQIITVQEMRQTRVPVIPDYSGLT